MSSRLGARLILGANSGWIGGLAWIHYGYEVVRDRIAITLAMATPVAFPFNLLRGGREQAFEDDLSEGLSWQELADRHHKFLMHWNERMRMLHDAKTGPLGRATPRETHAPIGHVTRNSP
jgi:hypothetical protein